MNRGVQEFYYTQHLPSKAVAIAQVSIPPISPADLTDINNTPYLPGNLEIRKSLTLDSSPADFTAPDFMQPVEIFGATQYRVYNQFFEITNVLLSDDTPAFYVHALPSNIDQQVVIVDLQNNTITTPINRSGNLLYHSLDGAAYRIRYVDPTGYLHTDLLQYTPVLTLAPFAASTTTYTLSGRFLTVAGTGNFWLRFTAPDGYLALQPYNAQPNTPWYVRIRFSLTPIAPEWATQIFLPQRPYQLATWVPGTVLDSSIIEFERKQIFYDSAHLPDILVFDKNNVIKYALEGTLPGTPRRRGTLYNWKRGLTQFVDPYKARVQVAVTLDPTDIVFGFYSYLEPDVIYRGLDVNPFTNPSVKDQVVQFYFKTDGADPLHYIYHQVIDPVTGPIVGATNDTNPLTGTNHVFATLAVGGGISAQNFTITDIRNRGGGLATEWQTIPQAVNFWDLGFWDGKPYPVGGALAVYIPAVILNTMSRVDVQSRVQSSLPVGTIAVIHYYNDDGSELV